VAPVQPVARDHVSGAASLVATACAARRDSCGSGWASLHSLRESID